MTALILAGFVTGAGYVLVCAVHPVHKCPRCRGRKVVRKGNGYAPCGKCKGHGRTRRPGAATVHQLLLDHLGPWIRDRLRDAAEHMRDTQ
jgi:hypothetical protein